MNRLLLILAFLLPTSVLANEVHHTLLKRVVVFPISTDGKTIKNVDSSWWKIREALTENRRFLVASKKFMEQKDVFQPRGKLSPPDCILLGKLLDAHALISIELKDRTLVFYAYSAQDGFLLWKNTLLLHPSLPIEKQIEQATLGLTQQFVASIPYQGHQILDPLIGRDVYEEGDIHLAKVEIPMDSKVSSGDPIQWIRVTRQNPGALFINGGLVTVIAEGRVIKKERNILTVQVERQKDLNILRKNTPIRFPQEEKRLQKLLSESTRLSLDIVKSEMKSRDTKSQETKPLLTALASIANIAVFILLAF